MTALGSASVCCRVNNNEHELSFCEKVNNTSVQKLTFIQRAQVKHSWNLEYKNTHRLKKSSTEMRSFWLLVGISVQTSVVMCANKEPSVAVNACVTVGLVLSDADQQRRINKVSSN